MGEEEETRGLVDGEVRRKVPMNETFLTTSISVKKKGDLRKKNTAQCCKHNEY